MAEKEAEKKTEVKGDQVVTPWEAKAGEGQTGIDYDKLISKLLSTALGVKSRLVFLKCEP